MAFDWGRAGIGVATGGLSEVARGLFGRRTSDVSQVPLETPEQAEARRKLLEFSKTGRYGNYTAGAAYGGSLGDFGMTALEEAGQSKVYERLQGGGISDTFFKDLLGGEKYNPLAEGGAYDLLRGGIDRATNEAQTRLKRGSAFGGSLYSTDTIRNLGDIESRGAETKATTMASLFQNYINQKLSAAPVAAGIERGYTDDAYTYGALPRNLKNAEAQAKYGEFQRQRGEQQGQITALSQVAGGPAQFGVPTVSVPKDNPWLDVLSLLAQFGGKYAGAKAGAA